MEVVRRSMSWMRQKPMYGFILCWPLASRAQRPVASRANDFHDCLNPVPFPILHGRRPLPRFPPPPFPLRSPATHNLPRAPFPSCSPAIGVITSVKWVVRR